VQLPILVVATAKSGVARHIIHHRKDTHSHSNSHSHTLSHALTHIHMHAANVGDARVVLVKNSGETIQLSVDHVPDDENERRRIQSFNPNPKLPLVQVCGWGWGCVFGGVEGCRICRNGLLSFNGYNGYIGYNGG
jgi:hypothetical protein